MSSHCHMFVDVLKIIREDQTAAHVSRCQKPALREWTVGTQLTSQPTRLCLGTSSMATITTPKRLHQDRSLRPHSGKLLLSPAPRVTDDLYSPIFNSKIVLIVWNVVLNFVFIFIFGLLNQWFLFSFRKYELYTTRACTVCYSDLNRLNWVLFRFGKLSDT